MTTWIATKLCNSYTAEESSDIYSYVHGIAVDNSGNLYFTTGNTNIYHIQRDSISTEPRILVTIPKSKLRGIVWNQKERNLYLCDNESNRILSYSIDTKNIVIVTGSTEESRFTCLRGMDMDKNGDIYITDSHIVRKISLSQGIVTTIAGKGQHGHQDGNAEEATFRFPFGITVSDDNTIYIADTDNHCIRKIKDGIVSTIAGKPLDSGLYYPKATFVMNAYSLLISDLGGVKRMDLNRGILSSVRGLPKGSKRDFAALNRWQIVVGTDDCVMLLTDMWKWRRWIWIGNLKEHPKDCLLATLPRDIIKEITQFI